MREIAPQHEEHWFAIYGRIALTGEPARFENQAAQLHRWYDVHAFRVGEPHERKVAIFFDDITARKRTEDELARSRQELKDKSLLLQSVLDSMAEGLVVADEQENSSSGTRRHGKSLASVPRTFPVRNGLGTTVCSCPMG